ncbi:MAG: GlxA family transcriptional regulator [Notoacmeibacter sp.]|nr:GlxA family transcriptional regulator [Notoacmeibacter sp.]
MNAYDPTPGNSPAHGAGVTTVRTFTFLLYPRFSMLCFASAIEQLRVANRLLGEQAYLWRLVTKNGEDAEASNGITFSAHHSMKHERELIRNGEKPDYFFVVASLGFERFHDPEINYGLQMIERQGVSIGGISNGAWILADAGLLDGSRCCIHWETIPAFTEKFPEVIVYPDIFEHDGRHYTCAGGTAAIDMMLHLIGSHHGEDLARGVAEQALAERQRGQGERQRLPLRARLGITSSRLLSIIELMESNVAEPLSLAEIADYTGLSRRQIERLFSRNLGRSPARYYLEVRLDRARHLLVQTWMPMIEVAVACGFVSASHFSKCYRDVYGRSPQHERQNRERMLQ